MYVIMEFARHGNLRDFLRQRRTRDASSHDDQCNREPSDVDDVISGDTASLTHNDLLSFGAQVARGLQFLTAKLVSGELPHFIHCSDVRLYIA